MLTGIRNVTRGWIAGGLLAILAGAFAIFGVEDFLKPRASNAIAYGSGVTITSPDFSRQFDNAIEENQKRLNRTVTKQEAFDAGLADQVMGNLVAQESIDALATKAGFVAPNSMIAEMIRKEPGFKNQITGKFDRDQYYKLLSLNKVTEQSFTDDLRGRMLRRQFAEAIIGGVHAPSSITAIQIVFNTERRVLSLAAIDKGRVGKQPEPTDAEVLAFYNKNKSNFKTPELRNVTIVKARPEAFEARVDVPEEKIKAQYDYENAQSGVAERRSFTQITAPNKAAAEEAARRLAAGEDPQKIAAAIRGQSLGFDAVTKGSVPNGSIAEAVFKLQKGQSTGAISDKLGWAAARLTDIAAATGGPSYEAQHDALRAKLAKEEGADALKDALDKFDQDRSGGMAVEEAAKRAGLDVLQLQGVSKEGQSALGPAPILSETPDLLKATFLAPTDEPTDFSPTTDGGYALVRVDKIIPPGVRPFEELKAPLTQRLRDQKIGDAMRALADAVTKDVAGGKSFVDAVKAQKLHLVGVSQVLDRGAMQQSDIPMVAAQAFNAKEGDVILGPDRSGSVLVIAQVEKILRLDPSTQPQIMAQAAAQVSDAITNDFLLSLETQAKSESKVKVDKAKLKQSLGVEDTATPDAQ